MSAESSYLSRHAAFWPSRVTPGIVPARVVVLVALCCLAASAQTAQPANSYAAAMAQTQPNTRILAIQDFLAHDSSSSRKIDALEVLVWGYKQIGNHQKASD